MQSRRPAEAAVALPTDDLQRFRFVCPDARFAREEREQRSALPFSLVVGWSLSLALADIFGGRRVCILAKGTELLVAVDRLPWSGLSAPADGGLVSLPGVISCRQQVAPRLLAVAAR
jgi:hypothetical protein